MIRWEYRTEILQNDKEDQSDFNVVEINCEKSLSNFGEDGWELVSVVPYDMPNKPKNNRNTIKMFMKRPVE